MKWIGLKMDKTSINRISRSLSADVCKHTLSRIKSAASGILWKGCLRAIHIRKQLREVKKPSITSSTIILLWCEFKANSPLLQNSAGALQEAPTWMPSGIFFLNNSFPKKISSSISSHCYMLIRMNAMQKECPLILTFFHTYHTAS